MFGPRGVFASGEGSDIMTVSTPLLSGVTGFRGEPTTLLIQDQTEVLKNIISAHA
jgi:hypothetical protein